MRHNWTPTEIAETIRIALLNQADQPMAIARLTQRIQQACDPDMDEGRVRTAVCAAVNCLAGQPDVFPKSSKELRRQVALLNRMAA